jgi:DNA-3-methyladenine glycosylase
MSDILPLSWFQRETSEVAYDLIGCILCKRQPDGKLSAVQLVKQKLIWAFAIKPAIATMTNVPHEQR